MHEYFRTDSLVEPAGVTYVMGRSRCKIRLLTRSEITRWPCGQLPRIVSSMTVFGMKPALEPRYNES